MNSYPPEAGEHPPPVQQYAIMSSGSEREKLGRQVELYVYLAYASFNSIVANLSLLSSNNLSILVCAE
jgi:hypothetical protein